MIRQKEFNIWLENPVTLEFLDLLKEHRQASFRMITDHMVNVSSMQKVDLYEVAQYRGYVHICDELLDIKDFLLERVEVQNEELQTTGISSSVKD